jgi:hypothetical protein
LLHNQGRAACRPGASAPFGSKVIDPPSRAEAHDAPMNSVALAVFLKPFAYFVLFVLIVAPITWVLWRLIPDGRFKTSLFRVRDTEGEWANLQDLATMGIASAICLALLFAFIAYLYR